jgi:hypothetical protein
MMPHPTQKTLAREERGVELRRPAQERERSSAIARQEKLESASVELESAFAELNRRHVSSSGPPPRSPRLRRGSPLLLRGGQCRRRSEELRGE